MGRQKDRRWNWTHVLLTAAAVLCLCSCQPQSMTVDLEEMPLNAEAQAMIQAMEEYQAMGVERYSYPAIGSWMTINRTASIMGAEEDEIVVLTRDDAGSLEWRHVQYVYPFYDSDLLSDGTVSGEDPLLIGPLVVSPDGVAVAYQSLHTQGRFLEIAEAGRSTVMVGGDGKIYTEEVLPEEVSWGQLKFDWSGDGKTLMFYRSDNWGIALGTARLGEEIELESEEPPSEPAVQGGAVLGVGDIYGYDRVSGQVRKIWEAMRLNLPVDQLGDPEVIADVNGENAAMFLLFDEAQDCEDVQLWNHGGILESSLVNLPDDPCIQMDLENGIYYYRDKSDIWKAPLGKSGQSQLIMAAGAWIQDFLISEDEHRIFTIEKREDTADICLYLQDEKGSWYKQAIAVGARGACSLQLSDDQNRLLVECQTEEENYALIICFAS